jgi:hypothetical protein
MTALYVPKSRSPWRRLAAPLFVWSVWTVMSAVALVYVAAFGSNVPSWDGWDMVPTLTGDQPITAEWLWSQHNEHRIPVPRLLFLGLNRLFGPDFRVGMYFNVLATAALAAAMIVAVQHLRGRLSAADAFFPVLLLNLGQGLNFIWGWQVEFFLSTVLAGWVLLVIVESGPRPTVRRALAAWIGIVLLAGSGAHGVVLVPALALWLGWGGVSRWRSGEPQARWEGLLILGMALAGLGLVAFYLVGYQRVPYHPTPAGPIAIVRTAAQFLTMGFGPAVRLVWPFSGLAVFGLLLFSAALLVGVVSRDPAERHRALGFGFFLAAMGCLALALGMGRNGFEPRYITLSVPALCAIYFLCTAYGRSAVNGWARGLLFAGTCLALWPNTQSGIDYATDLRARLGAFEQDMVDGVPSYRLIQRYWPYLHIHQDILSDYMPMLRKAGIGSFVHLKDNPTFQEIPVALEPAAVSQLSWEDTTAHATGNAPFALFSLPQERYVCGIRMRYTYENHEGTLPYVSLYWKGNDQPDFTDERSWKNSPTGDRANWERGTWLRLADPENRTTIWICDRVKEIRLHPDFKPGLFRISEFTLLVPVDE